MSLRPGLLLALLILVFSAHRAEAQLSYEIAFPNLSFTQPVAIEHAPDGNDRLYVVEQPGQIKVFDNQTLTSSATTFLDIRPRVNDSGWEEGLLGLAFHPNYAENGYFFVNYTASGPRRTVVSRFSRSADDPLSADPDSELIIIEFSQPFGNHNGGDVAFGPDGYLYIAVGDGGSGNDPQDHGQNDTTLLGTILRLNVDNNLGSPPDCGSASPANYSIPDNAIADGPGGACDEIYAYGLRNPWRFSFDSVTGEFWVADVGQVTREEINIVQNGDNLGWRVYEGTLCTGLGSAHGPPCGDPDYVHPIWEYGFAGAQSITGGFVYRGDQVPELAGKYVYADFMTGHIWALSYADTVTPQNEQLYNTNLSIATFGVDMHDHLYFSSLGNGRIYTFRSESVSGEEGGTVTETTLRLAGPNPFQASTALEFAVTEPGHVRVALVDLLGREVATLFDGPALSGDRIDVPVSSRGLAPGVYVARLSVDGRPVASERLTVVGR